MTSRNPQTQAKRAREQAVKERRDRKRAKKAEAAAERAARQVHSGEAGGGDVFPAAVATEAPPSQT